MFNNTKLKDQAYLSMLKQHSYGYLYPRYFSGFAQTNQIYRKKLAEAGFEPGTSMLWANPANHQPQTQARPVAEREIDLPSWPLSLQL